MDVKQEQDSFELAGNLSQTEPEIGTSQTNQNEYCPDPRTFKNEHGDVIGDTKFNDFEYQTTAQFPHIVTIKKEIIECKMPKIESLDLPTKIEILQIDPKTIKQELENTCNGEVTDIKQEFGECIQPKTESAVSELLTSHCDLPTLKIENTDDYPDNCLGHTYSSKSLKNNAQVILKKKKRYKCPICQNNFSSKSISSHIDGHFEKRHAVCQFCGRVMKKIEFFQHFFIHVVKNRKNNHIDDKPSKCHLSSKELKGKNIDVVDGKSFKCGTCFKTFNLKYTLQRHLVIHSDKKPFKCDICYKCFYYKYSLQKHLTIHSNEKPFKCDICYKCFNYKYSLQKHLTIHSGDKPFKCDFCLKRFNQNCYLQRHLLIHTGKPFKCDICFKSFTRKYNLQTHLIIHSGEKPYNCNICSKEFNRKGELQRHILIHSNEKLFKCDICFKCFNTKPNLQRHLICHRGEKPFNCDICSKGFKQKSALNRHLVIHSNERPFTCDICSKRFNQKSSLKRHLTIHTNQNF